MGKLKLACSLLFALVVAAGVSAQRPVPVSYIGIGSRDYTNNVTATDRVQNLTYPFHHPAIESNMGPVAKVVYVKGQSPSIVVTLTNTASTAIPSQVNFTNFRLETPLQTFVLRPLRYPFH